MKKRILSALLAAAMMLTMAPAAFAAESDSTPAATSLPGAVDGLITLETNTDISTTGWVVDGDITLDLAGHELKAANTNSGNIQIPVNTSLTLKDSVGNGKIYTETDYTGGATGYALIDVTGGSFTMESGLVEAVRNEPANKGQFALGIGKGGSMTINGGKIEAGWYAISGNGNDKTAQSTVVVNGGELISTADYALYLPHNGNTTVKGGTVYGAAGGISIQRGTLNISDDAVVTSKGTGSTGDWGDGTGGQEAAAVNIAGKYGDCNVNISGGKLTAEKNTLIIKADSTHKIDFSITGGTFSSDVSAYLDEGYVQNGNGVVVPLDEDNSVAKIGNKYYRTLEDALNEAADGNTVVVLKDATIGKAVEISAGTIEVNLNGKTVSYVPSKSNDDLAIIDINGSANVTVTGNGSFTFTNDYFTSKMDELGYIFRLSGDASLTIENGNYHAVLTCVQAGENATATIQGGTFSTEIEWNGTRWHLNLIDNSNAKIIVTGGTFVEYDPSNCKNENPAANFVDPNYSVTQEGNNYIVQKIENKLIVDKGDVEGTTQSATLAGDFAPNASVEGDKEGSKVDGYDVSLDLSNEDGNKADTVNLTVTKETAKSLADASSLSVATDAGTVELNAAALDKVGKTEGDVVIKIQKNTDAAGDNVKASYTVSVQTGETNLLPYGESNGTVTITVPKDDATVAWYVTGKSDSKVYVEKLDTREVGENLAITIGHLSTIELLAKDPDTTAVATVTVNGKTTGYNTLNDALAAATADSTIKLLKDVEISDKIVIANDNVTFDGGNHTIKLVTEATGTDGKPPVNSIFEVTGDNVTIQNAKLVDEAHKAKHGVQFYESKGSKLSNVDITGTAWTGVLVNGSTVTIENSKLNPDKDAYATIEYAMGKGVATVPEIKLDNASTDGEFKIWADNATVEKVQTQLGGSADNDDAAKEILDKITTTNNEKVTVSIEVIKGQEPEETVKPDTKPSSGGSSTTSYAVTVDKAENGTVSASTKYASKGRTVTLTVSPDKGYELDDLTVTDKNGKEVKLTDKGNGKFTFEMPASKVTVTASFVKDDGKPEQVCGFTDVKTTDWFAEEVEYVVDKGMMNGITKTTFAPNATTTRGMIVTILHRLEEEPSAAKAAFTDVADGKYYSKAIDWAAANGIVKGVSETEFAPDTVITREQMAAILYRYAQYKGYDVSKTTKLDEYKDGVEVSAYATAAMQWANAEGLITGKTSVTLVPKGSATRAEVATILMRFCENIVK